MTGQKPYYTVESLGKLVVIHKDGQPMTVEEIVTDLNNGAGNLDANIVRWSIDVALAELAASSGPVQTQASQVLREWLSFATGGSNEI